MTCGQPAEKTDNAEKVMTESKAETAPETEIFEEKVEQSVRAHPQDENVLITESKAPESETAPTEPETVKEEAPKTENKPFNPMECMFKKMGAEIEKAMKENKVHEKINEAMNKNSNNNCQANWMRHCPLMNMNRNANQNQQHPFQHMSQAFETFRNNCNAQRQEREQRQSSPRQENPMGNMFNFLGETFKNFMGEVTKNHEEKKEEKKQEAPVEVPVQEPKTEEEQPFIDVDIEPKGLNLSSPEFVPEKVEVPKPESLNPNASAFVPAKKEMPVLDEVAQEKVKQLQDIFPHIPKLSIETVVRDHPNLGLGELVDHFVNWFGDW